ncbi:hypothetical protein K457DRAFT_1729578 [Linnemannia elongata AG-77]|uniref:Transmembrane protein n=1 Tax=Linnemannia elongata AG-77 TaxID=1314771 RepID=A0A197JHQ9_9FUNG|nr:hypothetical protein K457DRAFT_1729578 [Linnemannia elongata AG-77]
MNERMNKEKKKFDADRRSRCLSVPSLTFSSLLSAYPLFFLCRSCTSLSISPFSVDVRHACQRSNNLAFGPLLLSCCQVVWMSIFPRPSLVSNLAGYVVPLGCFFFSFLMVGSFSCFSCDTLKAKYSSRCSYDSWSLAICSCSLFLAP